MGSLEQATSNQLQVLSEILGTTNVDLSPPDLDVTPGHSSNTLTLYNDNNNDDGLDHYEQEMLDYIQLDKEIAQSDKLLDIMEKDLGEFQGEINALSGDIESLQTRSIQLSQRIETRKQVESKLAPLIQALIIPPTIVKQIIEGEVSPQWRAALKYIVNWQKEMQEMKSTNEQTKAIIDRGKDQRETETETEIDIETTIETEEIRPIREAEDQIQLIIYKAVERIRDYIIVRIKSLRVAGINCQVVQHNLLEYKELHEFLIHHAPELAKDLKRAYSYTMRWYYGSYFARYIKTLEKMLPLYVIDKSSVLLGDDSIARRTGATGLLYARSSTSSSSAAYPLDYFNIGARHAILDSTDTALTMSQAITGNRHHHYYLETGFHNFNLALIDNATAEYQFINDFYNLDAQQTSDMFTEIFEHTVQHGHAFTKKFIMNEEQCFDAYGILICIRLCKKYELDLQHRKIPVLENYFNLQLINLWPKFQSVMDSHCESLRRASTRSTSYAFTNSSSSSNALVPHQITQQFASFLSGILSLCVHDDSQTEPVATSLQRLRNDFESFLTKISAALSDATSREKFLHHNYFLVSTVLADLPGKLASQHQQHFKLLTEAYDRPKQQLT